MVELHDAAAAADADGAGGEGDADELTSSDDEGRANEVGDDGVRAASLRCATRGPRHRRCRWRRRSDSPSAVPRVEAVAVTGRQVEDEDARSAVCGACIHRRRKSWGRRQKLVVAVASVAGFHQSLLRQFFHSVLTFPVFRRRRPMIEE